MPNRGYLPGTDSGLISWGRNAQRLMSQEYERLGLTSGAVSEAGAMYEAFARGYRLVNGADTDTSDARITMAVAREQWVKAVRRLVRVVQANEGTTDQDRTNLGITLPSGRRGPLPRPMEAPLLTVRGVRGRRFFLTLGKAEGSGCGRPPGVEGAVLFVAEGEAMPDEVSDYRVYGMTTRLRSEVVLGEEVERNTKVWLAAAWTNPRGQPGPVCVPVAGYTNWMEM